MRSLHGAIILPAVCLVATACGADGSSSGSARLSVVLEAEDTITEGIVPGDGEENMRDGWRADYDTFIVALGDVELRFATDPALRARDERVFAVDLTEIPSNGIPLWELDGLRGGRWTFAYATPTAEAALRHGSVTESDFDRLTSERLTYLITGMLSKEAGQSCPPPELLEFTAAASTGVNADGIECYDNPEIAFSLAVDVATSVGPCELDGAGDFPIPEGDVQTVAITIHGDHLFFNGFPVGDEAATLRLAQFLADCDLDLDGAITEQELIAVRPADLAEIDERYTLTGAPFEVADMMDWARAQLVTQPHFQGEGECFIRD
jgi:hypothetical protein